jgi:hypothetical protein
MAKAHFTEWVQNTRARGTTTGLKVLELKYGTTAQFTRANSSRELSTGKERFHFRMVLDMRETLCATVYMAVGFKPGLMANDLKASS